MTDEEAVRDGLVRRMEGGPRTAGGPVGDGAAADGVGAAPDRRVRVNLARILPDGHSLLARMRQDVNRQVRQAARRTARLPAPTDT
ncbi:hypothetical protein ACFRCW_19340 [Streptomyces sp. NPDC056653]|uniref:hypothetical protein n=1 Tax=Streptomyces sp. NPDC056653 TaxID=3345894 RepID=UPI0036772CE6